MHKKTSILIALIVCSIALWSCSDDETNPAAPGSELRGDCLGCHTSETMLRATAAPDTTPHNENPGEG